MLKYVIMSIQFQVLLLETNQHKMAAGLDFLNRFLRGMLQSFRIYYVRVNIAVSYIERWKIVMIQISKVLLNANFFA